MALKHRVALGVALLMVLVLVAILPPRSCGDVEDWGITATALCSGTQYPWGRTHQRVVDRTRTALAQRLREHELADSLRALADAGRGVRSADGSVVVLHETSLTADSARVWLQLALGERERIATGRPHARIVLALRSRHARERSGQPVASPVVRRFTNIAGRDTTCYVTLWLGRDARADVEVVETDERGGYGVFLGSCGLVGRFGAASASAMRATRFAFRNERAAFWQRRSTALSARTGGIRPVDPRDYRFTGCMKGEAGACASVVGLGVESEAWMDWVGSVRGFHVNRDFLAYLREVEGPEKFQRFWQSPLPGDESMTDAFGRPAVETVRAWVQRDFSQPENDPTNVGAMALAALGWLGAALAAAIAIGKYRQASD